MCPYLSFCLFSFYPVFGHKNLCHGFSRTIQGKAWNGTGMNSIVGLGTGIQAYIHSFICPLFFFNFRHRYFLVHSSQETFKLDLHFCYSDGKSAVVLKDWESGCWLFLLISLPSHFSSSLFLTNIEICLLLLFYSWIIKVGTVNLCSDTDNRWYYVNKSCLLVLSNIEY